MFHQFLELNILKLKKVRLLLYTASIKLHLVLIILIIKNNYITNSKHLTLFHEMEASVLFKSSKVDHLRKIDHSICLPRRDEFAFVEMALEILF